MGFASVRRAFDVFRMKGFWFDAVVRQSDKKPQRAQYPLIKEYTLNHNMKPYIYS